MRFPHRHLLGIEPLQPAEIQTFLEETGVPGLSKPFDRSEVRRVIQRVVGAER